MFSNQLAHIEKHLSDLRYGPLPTSQMLYGYCWGYLRGLHSEGRISWEVYGRLMQLVDNAFVQVSMRRAA